MLQPGPVRIVGAVDDLRDRDEPGQRSHRDRVRGLGGVVVEPAQLVSADRAGLRLLYVTITRTTKTLTVVHAEPLPEGLAPR